jgi:hypothetical protein
MGKTPLNIALVGYGFMGRTHSNAFLQAPRFFDLPYQPVLKAVVARNADRVRAFAGNWGYESAATDWRTVVERKDIDLVDIAADRMPRLPSPRRRQDGDLREAVGRTAAGAAWSRRSKGRRVTWCGNYRRVPP